MRSPFAWIVLLLVACALPVRAEPSRSAPCTLVFGHGRNHEPAHPQQDQHWDALNLQFNRAVLEPFEAAGQRVVPLLLPVAATDLARNLQQLLGEAQRQGCNQVLETTLFADPEAGTLMARLRLYPLLGSKGPRPAQALPQVGAPSYVNQRDFDLSPRALERLRPQLLGREMGQQALEHVQQGRQPAGGLTAGRTAPIAP